MLDGTVHEVFTEDSSDSCVDRRDHVSPVEHDRAIADRANLVGVVGDEQDRSALVLKGADSMMHLAWKRSSRRQALVDDEDVGIDVHGDREGSGRTCRWSKLHLGVDEVLDLTEVDHVVEDALHHFLEKPSIAP